MHDSMYNEAPSTLIYKTKKALVATGYVLTAILMLPFLIVATLVMAGFYATTAVLNSN